MTFLESETGAVTVDWVVLTAALVGLGLSAMSVVSSGVEDISGDVEDELTSTTIYSSFNQRNHSGLYEAYIAFEAATTNPARDGAGASNFEDFISDFKGYDNSTVLMLEGMLASNVASNTTQINAIDGTSDLEALSYEDISAINGVPAATVQSNVEGAYGSKTAFLASFRASAVLGVLHHEAYVEEVAVRGL